MMGIRTRTSMWGANRARVALAIIATALVVSCGANEVSAPKTASAPATTVAPVASTVTSTSAPTTTTTLVLEHHFPIEPVSVVDYGPGHHDYPATDMFCPPGSTFVAVTSGTVDFVSDTDLWDPATDDPVVRGGLSVAIVGDDGVRYYGSHLSSVAPGITAGVRVEAGDVLGATGNSGNARFTDPHLHFGVSHPTTADDWAVRRGEVDTYPLLQAWERGENVTPVVPGA